MKVKVKSKVYCILWALLNGICIPKKYYLVRPGKFKEGEHNFFSYGKLSRCGKSWPGEKLSYPHGYYEVEGYQFHESCIKEPQTK